MSCLFRELGSVTGVGLTSVLDINTCDGAKRLFTPCYVIEVNKHHSTSWESSCMMYGGENNDYMLR